MRILGASMEKRLGASMRMLGASMRKRLGASMRMLGASLGVGSFPKPPSGPRPRPPGLHGAHGSWAGPAWFWFGGKPGWWVGGRGQGPGPAWELGKATYSQRCTQHPHTCIQPLPHRCTQHPHRCTQPRPYRCTQHPHICTQHPHTCTQPSYTGFLVSFRMIILFVR